MEQFKPGPPARQNFYEVQLADGQTLIAEWRQRNPELGKVWWEHYGTNPTDEKQPRVLANVTGYRKADAHAVSAALRRELTEDEHVQASFKGYRARRAIEVPVQPVPESRKVGMGEIVRLGALKAPVVVGLHDDGRLVTVRHQTKNRDSRTETTAYLTVAWFDVLPCLPEPLPERLSTRSLMDRLTYMTSSVDSVIHRLLCEQIDVNPDYQRGYTWTLDDKNRFLDSLFAGRDIGRFIFIRYPYPQATVLFDGKQRSQTLVELITSQLPYKGKYWHELHPRDQNDIESKLVHVAEFEGNAVSRSEVLQLFLDVNAAGVPQTEEHLQHVRELLKAEQAK
jgi:hypothetical protein